MLKKTPLDLFPITAKNRNLAQILFDTISRRQEEY